MGLDVEEALLGITRRAGGALHREELGWIGKGSAADLALFELPPGEAVEPEVLVQYLGDHRARVVIREGRRVWG
jgi:imidazolonepropionase-like amidohydrolase